MSLQKESAKDHPQILVFHSVAAPIDISCDQDSFSCVLNIGLVSSVW